MLWVERKADENSVDSLSRSLSISPALSRLLHLRGFDFSDSALDFLKPKLAHLADPFEIPRLREAVLRIIKSIESREGILLVGDYDVDGITSTVLVKKILATLGSDPFYVIPRRKDEGYGLTKEILARGLKLGDVKLVIALDCGTNSFEEAKILAGKGIDLVVVDHHQAKEELPEEPIMLNPHLHPDEGEPWRNLCTAGLAFKLIHGLIKELRGRDCSNAHSVDLKKILPFVALGTIADLVPLRLENRILARFGLKHLGKNSEPGLVALLAASGIATNHCPESEDITFKLAPRINACGRLNDPEVASNLFLEQDREICGKLARQMNDYNEERKLIEAQLTDEALLMAKEKFSDSPGVVVCGEGKAWNPGVVGIVAGKMANSLGKPCLVLAQADEEEYRGSGRGVPGFDLVKTLTLCKEHLLHWGGHPVAVGLSLHRQNIDAFTKAFIRAIFEQNGGTFEDPSLLIDLTISSSDLQPEFLEELNHLAPYGQENPEPLLAILKTQLAHPAKKVGSGEHFQFSLHNGTRLIQGIAWKMASKIPPANTEIDLAFRLRWNEWNGRKNLQMVLEDWKLSS